MKKLSIIIATICIFLLILTPTSFAEEILSFTDDIGDVIDIATGNTVDRPNIDIYKITCSQDGKVVELKLQLATSGKIINEPTTAYSFNLETDLNSYMAIYGLGENGVTDQDSNEIDAKFSGEETNELKISFNLTSADEECLNLTVATFELSGLGEEGYIDEYPNEMEMINVEINSPSTGTVGKSIKFTASTTYEGDEGDLDWLWDFGDGETSNIRSPSHTYDENGTYEIFLEVSDLDGMVYGYDNITITINPSGTPGNGDSNDSGSGLIVFIVLIVIVVIIVVAVVFFIRRK